MESAVPVVEYTIIMVGKVFRSTPWEHVEYIFCRNANGRLRKMRYSDVLRRVVRGTAHFYVIHRGRRIELEIAHNALGYECLRATIGGQKTDVLLTLPDYRDPVITCEGNCIVLLSIIFGHILASAFFHFAAL